jgi:DNA-binding NarL/FixJ family response regulator
MDRILADGQSRSGLSAESLSVIKHLREQIQSPQKTPASTGQPSELTPRETEIVGLLARGLTNKAIGSQLFISPGTVKAHTASIFRKLDAANRTEAVTRARELNLV